MDSSNRELIHCLDLHLVNVSIWKNKQLHATQNDPVNRLPRL